MSHAFVLAVAHYNGTLQCPKEFRTGKVLRGTVGHIGTVSPDSGWLTGMANVVTHGTTFTESTTN